MQMFLRRYRLWLFYALFIVMAWLFGGREPFLSTESDHPVGKFAVLAVFLGFLAFSLYATMRENFFRSLVTINKLFWGKQIGLDLYISVFLSLALIYLVEGSIIVVLLWLIPVLIFANLAILPYILLNYAAIVGHFLP